MKHHILSLILIFSLSSCHKYSDNVDLTGDISIGESKLYVNGEDKSSIWERKFILKSFTNGWIFLNLILKVDIVFTSLTLSNFELSKIGFHDFQKDPQKFNQGVVAYLDQYVDEDLKGYKYELHNEDENFFELIKVDTIQKEIEFRFRVHYKCVDKNDNEDLGWPKYLKFEGHYHEPYE